MCHVFLYADDVVLTLAHQVRICILLVHGPGTENPPPSGHSFSLWFLISAYPELSESACLPPG